MRRYCYIVCFVFVACSSAERSSAVFRTRTTTIRRQHPRNAYIIIRGGADEAQQDNVQEEEDVQLSLETEVQSEITDSIEKEKANSTEIETTESTETEITDSSETDELVVDTAARESRQEEALRLRQIGKDLHDSGLWEQAAITFRNASLLAEDDEQEYATSKLHEALCRLKLGHYTESQEACTLVLEKEPPAPIRARALHRRARAKLGVGDNEGALQDARSAAFLGDRKAVAFYGKLMRQDSDVSLDSASSSALLESLLQKSDTAEHPLASMLSDNGGGLAKSVLSFASKQVENEATQERLCRYLKNTNSAQVQQLAAMAGVPLSQDYAQKLVDFCHGVTPRGIQKSTKLVRIVWYVVSLVRKVALIFRKYRMVIIAWFLLAWIKSAILRPTPINKRAVRLAAKQAATM